MKRKALGIFSAGALLAAGAYGLVGASLYFNQEAYIFHPRRDWMTTPESAGLAFEDVTFRAADGIPLSGWYVPAENARGTLLFLHGNSRNISYEMQPIGLFHGLGLDLFIFDYRGFGHSGGKISPGGLPLDAEAALAYLTDTRKIPLERIFILGRSFGGALAIPLAVRHKPKGLLVDASFTSLAEMAENRYPYFPVRRLLKYRFDSLDRIPEVRCPVLVTHSRQDQVIPWEQGQRLFQAVTSDRQFLEITGPHDNRDDPAAQALYRQGVDAWLRRLWGAAG